MSQPSHNDQKEIEVKLLTPDLADITERLQALGALCETERIYERNVRYENEAGTLTASGVVVRLRQDGQVRLTYKGANIAREDGLSEREELEVSVSDFGIMEAILARLGYHPYMIYEKYRMTYTLEGCEIVLDEMPYGNFTEIEGTPEAIEATVIRLGLAEARRYSQSYAQIFERVRGYLGLDFHDLTFANFEGVDVPAEALG